MVVQDGRLYKPDTWNLLHILCIYEYMAVRVCPISLEQTKLFHTDAHAHDKTEHLEECKCLPFTTSSVVL